MCICLLVSQVHASSFQQQFQQRKNQLFQWADTTDGNTLLLAAAKIWNGNQRQEGIELFNEILTQKQGRPLGMFDFYRLMIGYYAARDVLPDEAILGVKELLKNGNFSRGDTENHLTMYYTGLYLAAQAFPDLRADEWYTGKSTEENKQEALGWFRDWIHLTTTIGQGEFDSPTYMAVYLSALTGLYQWCEDPVFKEQIHAMVLWLLADYAVEHLDGVYTGAHSREYPDRLIYKRHHHSEMNYWAWFLFGTTDEPMYSGIVFPMAMSDFQVPDILYQIATDREEPYVHTETKRVRHVLRFGEKRNPLVYKMTYMTDEFALGSMMGGATLQPIQQHTWDVSYVSDSPYGTLFTVHPWVGVHDMGMFFPEEMKFSTDAVVKAHTYYADEGKWASSSPFEQTFQHKNAIIVLYHIPEKERYGHIDGFFPADLERQQDDSGWIFCRDSDTFIAYFPLQPYEWIKEEEGYRLRSRMLKNGCVVEVAQARDYASFEAFQQDILDNVFAHDTFEQSLSVSYTTCGGDVMTFTYDGARKLNGKTIDFDTYNLFRGPFLNADMYKQRLHIGYKDTSLILTPANPEQPILRQ